MFSLQRKGVRVNYSFKCENDSFLCDPASAVICAQRSEELPKLTAVCLEDSAQELGFISHFSLSSWPVDLPFIEYLSSTGALQKQNNKCYPFHIETCKISLQWHIFHRDVS